MFVISSKKKKKRNDFGYAVLEQKKLEIKKTRNWEKKKFKLEKICKRYVCVF